MAMMESYYVYQEEIEKKYGVHSVIMMMVGSFYEVYEYDKIGRATTISSLLNITLTKKDKKKESSKTNPYMCGFPSHSLKKFVEILVKKYDYTVGIVDQSDGDVGKLKQRELAKVYSPCIPFEFDFEMEDNYMMDTYDNVCMLFSVQKQMKNHLCKDKRYFLFYIILNLSLGTIYFSEEEYHMIDDVYDSLNRIFIKENVKERIIVETDPDILNENALHPILTHRHLKLGSQYKCLTYQQKVLSKVYTNSTEKDVICDIDLERYPSIVQYLTFLFDFIYDHFPLVLSKVQRPYHIMSRSQMAYNIRSYYELNILNQKTMNKRLNKTELSLIKLLDKTCTSMGSRYLHHLFFVPTFDMDTLNDRYDKIEYYMKHPKILSQKRLLFSSFCDIEKKFRLMCVDRISPYDMFIVLKNIQTILTHHLCSPSLEIKLKAFLRYCEEMWDVEKMEGCKSVFKYEDGFFRNRDEDIDDKQKTWETQQLFLDKFVERTDNLCQIKYGSNDEVQLLTTKKKWSFWKGQLTKEGIHIIEMKSHTCYIHSVDLDTACKSIQTMKQELKELWRHKFSEDIKSLLKEYGDILKDLCKEIQVDDVVMTFADCSLTYKYVRPIIDDTTSISYIECEDMRHPIIEQINDNEPFTPNNVCLSQNNYGMLVYGLNSAGKSTLLKSIGLCVVMAQIGMFVPCKTFKYHPFHNMMTKIYAMDNIYNGQSTFLYELNELKHILNSCNEHTIILCDELTSGTETYSATGLMASTLLQCIDHHTKFVFTTHLHTLSNVPTIVKNPHIQIVHFAVSIVNNKIIYNRTLEEGMGTSLYGIEIAEALGFNAPFIKVAFDVRNKIAGKRNNLVKSKKSRYNSKVIMDTCSECGGMENLHTHHITPQKLSDEDGYIGTFHKNKKFNLKVLCHKCHEHEHKQTTDSTC